MSLTGVLLGLINICIVIACLVLIVLWILGIVGFPVPIMVQRLFMVIIALIALYMIVALLVGVPSIRITGHVDAISWLTNGRFDRLA